MFAFLAKLFRRNPPPEAAHMGRNEPCWCGSGKKYKKCHREADKRYFERTRPLQCTSSS